MPLREAVSNRSLPISRGPSLAFPRVTLAQAYLYIEAAEGDELRAAVALATDRLDLEGSVGHRPDEAEVHHALFLLRRARGLPAPSFDWMRVELRTTLAA
jgi:hypothetical protein